MSWPQGGQCNGKSVGHDEQDCNKGNVELEDHRFSGGGKECPKVEEHAGLVDYDDDSEEETVEAHESRKRLRNDSDTETEPKMAEESSSTYTEGSAKRAKLDSSQVTPDRKAKAKEMKVADLRRALEERGLSSSGTKADMAARLKEAVRHEHGDEVEMEEDPPEPSQQNVNEESVVEDKTVVTVAENGDIIRETKGKKEHEDVELANVADMENENRNDEVQETQTDVEKESMVTEKDNKNEGKEKLIEGEDEKLMNSEKENRADAEKENDVENRIDEAQESRVDVEKETQVKEKDNKNDEEKEKLIDAEKEKLIDAEKEKLIDAEKEARVDVEKESRVNVKDNMDVAKERLIDEEKEIRAEEEKEIRAEEEKEIRAEEEKEIRAEEEKEIRAEEEKEIRAEEKEIRAEEKEIRAEEGKEIRAEEGKEIRAEGKEIRAEEGKEIRAEEEKENVGDTGNEDLADGDKECLADSDKENRTEEDPVEMENQENNENGNTENKSGDSSDAEIIGDSSDSFLIGTISNENLEGPQIEPESLDLSAQKHREEFEESWFNKWEQCLQSQHYDALALGGDPKMAGPDTCLYCGVDYTSVAVAICHIQSKNHIGKVSKPRTDDGVEETHITAYTAANSHKSPVSQLHGLSHKLGWTVDFRDLEQELNSTPAIPFTVECQFGQHHSTGSSETKKDAKNKAAKSMLEIWQKTPEEETKAESSASSVSNDSFFDLPKNQPKVHVSELSEETPGDDEDYINPMSDGQRSNEDKEYEAKLDSDDDDSDVVDLDFEDEADAFGEEDEDEESAETLRHLKTTKQQAEAIPSGSDKSKAKKLYVMKWVSCEDNSPRAADDSQYVDTSKTSELEAILPHLLARCSPEFLRNLPNLLGEINPQAKSCMGEAYQRPSVQEYPEASMQRYPGAQRFPGQGGLMSMFPQQTSMSYPGYPGLSLTHQYQQNQYLEQQQRMLLEQQVAARALPPRSPPPPQVKKYCQYPPPDTNEGIATITIAPADYGCLKKDQFLNDVIIDFFLKYLQYGTFPAEIRDNIHVFSTYFYDTLTKKRGGEIKELDPVKAAFRRYDRVKRWTRKVNLFEKEFVVVPINENYHWYVCIICFPGLDGCVDWETGELCDRPKKQVKRSKKRDRKVRTATAKSIRTEENQNKDRDEAEGDERDMDDEDDEFEKRRRKKKIVSDNEMDKSYGYSENGDECVDEENMYNENIPDEYSWNDDQEEGHEGVEEVEEEEELDHDEEAIVGSSENDVLISSEGDAVTEIVEDDNYMDNQNDSLDDSGQEVAKTRRECHGDDEIDDELEEDLNETDEDNQEDKGDCVDDEDEVLEEKNKINDIKKQALKDDLKTDSNPVNPDTVQTKDGAFCPLTMDQIGEVVMETTDCVETHNEETVVVKVTVNEQEKGSTGRPIGEEPTDSVKTHDEETVHEVKMDGEKETTVNSTTIKNDLILDNGEKEVGNGDTCEKEEINGKDVVAETNNEETELSAENKIAQVDGSIDLKDDEQVENTDAKKNSEEQAEESSTSQNEEEETQQEKNDLNEISSPNDEPIITLKVIGTNEVEPDSEILKKVAETQLTIVEDLNSKNEVTSNESTEGSRDADGDKTAVEMEEKVDLLLEEPSEALEEQEVVVDIKPEESDIKPEDLGKGESAPDKKEVDNEMIQPKDEDREKGDSVLQKNCNLEKKNDKVADLERMWSDPEDEDMETGELVSDKKDSAELENIKANEKLDLEKISKVLKDQEIDDEAIDHIDEEEMDDETDQIDEGGMEDVEMESDEDEIVFKQPEETFKLPVLPSGMTINRQRDPVLDDFESGIENLQHDMERDFGNRSSDEELSEEEEELEEEDLDVKDHQNQLPPSVFERLLQNREDGSMEDYDSRTQPEESEEESEIESSEDEEEEEVRRVKQPCILVFDSLGGTKARKSKVCNTIREYLMCEFMTKVEKDNKKFTKDFMPSSSPKVQQQPNFSDCGIYLLQFVESFFTNPIQDYTLPITGLKNWFPEQGGDGVNNKRSKIAKLIRDFTAEQNPGKDIRFPNLVFGSAPAAPPSDEPEDEEWNSDDDRSSDGSLEDGRDAYSGQQQYSEYRSPYDTPQQMFGVPPPASRIQGLPGMGQSLVAGHDAPLPGMAQPLEAKMNLPPGISISRKVDTEEVYSSDDDIIVDEGVGGNSAKKRDEWVEYMDQFGRTRRCLKSSKKQDQLFDEDLYMDDGMDRSRDEWENNYDEEETEDYEGYESNPSSPLEIIEETDHHKQEVDDMDRIVEPLSPFLSMVSHEVQRFSPFVSMVTHQVLNENVLKLAKRKPIEGFVSMVTHRVATFNHEEIVEKETRNDNFCEMMKEVSSSSANEVDAIGKEFIESDEEVETKVPLSQFLQEREEPMDTSGDNQCNSQPSSPISNVEPVDEKKPTPNMSPDTTTHNEDDHIDSSTETKEMHDNQSAPQNNSDVEMSVEEETSAEINNEVDSTKDNHSDNIDQVVSSDANAVKLPDLDEDMDFDGNLEDKEAKNEAMLDEEKIGQVDGSTDIKDDEQMDKSVIYENAKEQIPPQVSLDGDKVSRHIEGDQISPEIDSEQVDSSNENNLSSDNNEIASNDAKHAADIKHAMSGMIDNMISNMLDNVEVSAHLKVGNIPELDEDMYSENLEDGDIDDEIIEDDTLETPKTNEFTSEPFFKPPVEVNEKPGEMLLFEEENYSPQQPPAAQQQPPHLQSLLRRETPSKTLSAFGSLPGLSVSPSRHIPKINHSQETAFNQPGNSNKATDTPAEVTVVSDSDEEDDQPGAVFIKGNRLYQQRGKKQNRVGKYLCRDERGVVSVRNDIPQIFVKSQVEAANKVPTAKSSETYSYTSVDLANKEIVEDLDDQNEGIINSPDNEDEEGSDAHADQNDEIVSEPAHPSDDSTSKKAEIKDLDDESVESNSTEEPGEKSDRVAQAMKEFLDDDDW